MEEGGGIMLQFPAQLRNASERGNGVRQKFPAVRLGYVMKGRGNENIPYSRLACANQVNPTKEIRIRISFKINNSVGGQKAVFC